jgi:hypothetical protein
MSRLNVDQIYTRTGTGSPIIREMPAFQAFLGTAQNNVGSSLVKVNINTIDFDTNSWFDTVNYRYTPQIAGYYFFKGEGIVQTTTSVTSQQVQVRKNNTSIVGRVIGRATASNSYYIQATGLVYMNGSTDYVELWAAGTATVASGLTPGRSAQLISNNTTASYIDFSAEL